MNMIIREKEISAYEQEIRVALKRLREDAPPYQELQYFFQTVQKHFSAGQISQEKPKVIVMGTSVPEELIYACGTVPYWILGGSSQTAAWAGDAVPRDTDSISRSMLGFLDYHFMNLTENALILIPSVNDSSRKLAYLLRESGKKVHTIVFPPVKNQWSEEKWYRQWEQCREVLSAHTRRNLSDRKIREAAAMVGRCRTQMQKFLRVSHTAMSGACRMFVLFSYYCAEDIEEWSRHLISLIAECRQKPHIQAEKSNVLLMGSPVYFPNYKIPFLLEDAGLNISVHMDYTAQKVFTNPMQNAKGFYWRDCSDAYAKNNTLFQCVSKLIEKESVDGVVYQVLKGQIEYDFELERFEELFAKYDLPVFRLETDYNPQDIEQLRIRTEAFMEMLAQKRYRKEMRAV